jgi:hypothetical protein
MAVMSRQQSAAATLVRPRPSFTILLNGRLLDQTRDARLVTTEWLMSHLCSNLRCRKYKPCGLQLRSPH